mmetsp:Transcript_15092/g.24527  ORF Transcript_15092/g.24527 Transcript_15092/m.24527 type:complete len:500 (-) Transcript_15092:101-1600(-)|eukprot:CAMPEP_0203777872 /NCGR_PEP_ID=MMETSP0099_2-20121227/7650_1 /ASSEMBLY_ACC=CAM_ASM_000209 /TAXON_ID=96639 /ORGANISM=" , Strain NY0313808BC1" /LENGTH=499 /DNA_ID=CAMNT_0050677253 /DNA_START=438 /DNA_END=1937 /DNA_ORIENTATION=+
MAPTLSPTQRSCPSSWADPGYCQCPPVPPSECLLWGVAYPWLIVTAVIWILAGFANYLIYLLYAILAYILTSYKRKEWGVILRKKLVYWSTWLLRWGLIWAGVITLQMPNRVYTVVQYFFSIPFFILLLLWTNTFFDAISLIVRHEVNRKQSIANIVETEERERAIYSGEQVAEEESSLLGDAGNGGGENDKDTKEYSQSAPAYSHALEEAIRVVKYIAFIFIFVIGLQSNNVPVVKFFESATLFTLSIVFASQPWVRNLIGGIMVFFDDKYKINEFIRVVGVEGKVTSITLRATQILRRDKSIVYIPNGRVLEQPLSNYSRRKKRLISIRMQLSHYTKGKDIRKLLTELEYCLQTLHPDLTAHQSNRYHDDPTNVGSNLFVVLDNMFEILVWAYVSGDEKDEKAFTEIQSEVMLSITETMNRLGIQPASEAERSSRRDLPRSEQIVPEEMSFRDNLIKTEMAGETLTGVSDEYTNDDQDLAMSAVALLQYSANGDNLI